MCRYKSGNIGLKIISSDYLEVIEGGARQAIVHGVTKSRTPLSNCHAHLSLKFSSYLFQEIKKKIYIYQLSHKYIVDTIFLEVFLFFPTVTLFPFVSLFFCLGFSLLFTQSLFSITS